MLIVLPSTVSPLEVAWTTITFIGIVLALFNWYDAYGDLIELRRSGRNGILLIAARGEWNDHSMILLAMVCDFLVGVLAMFALPGREPDGDPSLSSIFSPTLIIIGALALIYLSFAKKRRRKKIMDALRGQQDDLMEQRHRELALSLAGLHNEVGANTQLTEKAVERAEAAYIEANHVNIKIEQTHLAGQVASEAGNKIMDALEETGKDTNERVKRVEAATVDVGTTLADQSKESNKRLDALEANISVDQSD